MRDERWRDHIRVEPDIVTAHASADRARRKALGRFDHADRSSSLVRWPAAAITVACMLILWMTTIQQPVEAPPTAVLEVHPTRVQFVLSDGTKVQWVFSDRFVL